MPLAGGRAALYLPLLNAAMDDFEINTGARQSGFLAQVAVESGSLRYVREIASGAAYEGRKDLGNIHPGDGLKYPGRGLLQVTGYDNTKACSIALFNDLRLLDKPQILEIPEYAASSAAWFWSDFKKLNELADAGKFVTITKRINGGTTALDKRQEFYARAKEVLIA